MLVPASFPPMNPMPYEEMVEIASSQESLLRHLFKLFAEQFAQDPAITNETRRRTKSIKELPPLGSVNFLNPENDYSKYDEDYTKPVGMLEDGATNGFWSWSDHTATIRMPKPEKHKVYVYYYRLMTGRAEFFLAIFIALV